MTLKTGDAKERRVCELKGRDLEDLGLWGWCLRLVRRTCYSGYMVWLQSWRGKKKPDQTSASEFVLVSSRCFIVLVPADLYTVDHPCVF